MKNKIIGVGALVVIALAVGGFFWVQSCREQQSVREMPINDVDLSKVADGSYSGGFTYGGFTYVVEVTVRSHRIEDIIIQRNRDTDYAKLAEGVRERVLSAQSLEVDAVTGATTTSKALLKAMENALAKGLQN